MVSYIYIFFFSLLSSSYLLSQNMLNVLNDRFNIFTGKISNRKFKIYDDRNKKRGREEKGPIKFVRRGILVKIMRESLRHRVNGTLLHWIIAFWAIGNSSFFFDILLPFLLLLSLLSLIYIYIKNLYVRSFSYPKLQSAMFPRLFIMPFDLLTWRRTTWHKKLQFRF